MTLFKMLTGSPKNSQDWMLMCIWSSCDSMPLPSIVSSAWIYEKEYHVYNLVDYMIVLYQPRMAVIKYLWFLYPLTHERLIMEDNAQTRFSHVSSWMKIIYLIEIPVNFVLNDQIDNKKHCAIWKLDAQMAYHCLNQWWRRFLTHICVARPGWLKPIDVCLIEGRCIMSVSTDRQVLMELW